MISQSLCFLSRFPGYMVVANKAATEPVIASSKLKSSDDRLLQYNSYLSSFITYHHICNMSNTTVASSETVSVPVHCNSVGIVLLNHFSHSVYSPKFLCRPTAFCSTCWSRGTSERSP
jgi:hypothetical protein